jgi:hypothetical protein
MSDEDAPASKPAETVAFILNYTRGVPFRQTQTMDALDGKATQLFAAASVVLGFTGFVLTHTGGLLPIQTVLILAAVAAYLGAVASTFYAVRPARYRQVDHATTLWQDYQHFEVEEIQLALVREIPVAAAFNQPIVLRKAAAVRWLLGFLAAEATLVAATVAVALLPAPPLP